MSENHKNKTIIINNNNVRQSSSSKVTSSKGSGKVVNLNDYTRTYSEQFYNTIALLSKD